MSGLPIKVNFNTKRYFIIKINDPRINQLNFIIQFA